MSNKSKIEWTDSTWNPVVGCSKVSEGCRNCYAMREAHRLAHNPMLGAVRKPDASTLEDVRALGRGNPYQGLTATPNGKPEWSNVVRCLPERLEQPLRWRRPRMIFVNSMSDLYHPDVPFEFIDRVKAIQALTPQHTYQELTKRPARMREYLDSDDREEAISVALGNMLDGEWIWNEGRRFRPSIERAITAFMGAEPDDAGGDEPLDLEAIHAPHRWPLPNVWAGVSCEDQATADERVPELLRTPAAVRFVSYEPALNSVKYLKWLHDSTCSMLDSRDCWQDECDCSEPREIHLDWIIAGGESGPGARPSHPDWLRSVRDECKAAGVPFFFKQFGEWWPSDQASQGDIPDLPYHFERHYWPKPDRTVSWRIGKKRAKRLLDGVLHDAMPVLNLS